MAKKVQYSSKDMLMPKYWPLWCAYFFVRLLVFLPRRLQLTIGSIAGRIFVMLPSKSRHITNVNLGICFPELSKSKRKQLLVDNFKSAGMTVMETLFAWFASPKRLRPLLKVKGHENVENTLASGKGILLLGMHFGCLDLIGRVYALDHDVSVVYANQRHPFLDHIVNGSRLRHYKKSIVRENLRGMIRSLKNGEMLWYTPDTDPRNKASLFAPFFGRPAATVITPFAFAKKTGAAIMFSTYHRLPDNSGYELTYHPPLENFPTGDDQADAIALNKMIEAYIREHPEQYIWQYKRFKTQTGNLKNPYKDKQEEDD